MVLTITRWPHNAGHIVWSMWNEPKTCRRRCRRRQSAGHRWGNDLRAMPQNRGEAARRRTASEVPTNVGQARSSHPADRTSSSAISASPTACRQRGYGRAGTQNDRLGEAVVASTGTSVPARWGMPSATPRCGWRGAWHGTVAADTHPRCCTDVPMDAPPRRTLFLATFGACRRRTPRARSNRNRGAPFPMLPSDSI